MSYPTWVEGLVNMINQNPYMSWSPDIFNFGTFLSVALSESRFIFILGLSSSPSNSFPMLLSLFGFSVMFSSFPYFAPKLFCFLVFWLLVCLRAFSPIIIIIIIIISLIYLLGHLPFLLSSHINHWKINLCAEHTINMISIYISNYVE